MSAGQARQEAATLSALLDSLACPALIVDRERRVRAVNAALRDRVPGRRIPPGSRCYELLHGFRQRCGSPRRDCPLERCLATGAPVSALHVIGRGTRRQRILLRPLLASGGRVVACLGTLDPVAPSASRDRRAPAHAGAAVAAVGERLDRLARGRRPVLLVGETGTGKASVARAIHRVSRVPGPFEERSAREIDAGGLRALLASARGTLYLSDVHVLDRDAQDALWDGLTRRRGTWRLVGGSELDIHSLAAEGRLRADLVKRLSARTVRLAPLRERPGDLPRVARRILLDLEGPGRALCPGALDRLRRHPFPGNFDELQQVLRHASLMAAGPIVRAEDLPSWLTASVNAVAGSGPRGRTPRGSTAR